jgi:DNA-binding MarR family transcriptional regulator
MRSAASLTLPLALFAPEQAAKEKHKKRAPSGGSAKAGAEPKAHAEAVYLDPVIHERTRLSILTALFTAGDRCSSFSDLRDTLSLTDGNLMAHLRTLEVAGLLERAKEGSGRNSSTTLSLSPAGKKAFRSYLDQLETLVRAARSGNGSGIGK